MLPRFLASVRSRRRWVLLLAVGTAAALAGRFLWAEFQLRAARRALERRAYPEAQAHLQRYLQVWPRSATAHLLGARCARGAGNFDEASSLLAACRHLHVDRDALILEEYLLDAQRGTLGLVEEEALRHRVEQGGPETPDILEAMTLGCLYTNRLGEAMACLERWLAYAPGDSQALYLRGLAREGMGAVHEAGEDYRQAVRRDPEHVPARKRRAEYLIYTGAYQEAAGLFQQLLEREPQDVNLILGLARCRRAQGKTAEAERLLDQLIGHGSAPAAVLVERSCLARETGDFRAAEKWYRQALAQDPSDYDACYGLGQCLRALGRPKEAQDFEAQAAHIDRDLKRLRQLHEEMAKNPDNVELPYEAGMICLRNGQKNEARRWFRNVLQGNPYHEEARKGLEQSVR